VIVITGLLLAAQVTIGSTSATGGTISQWETVVEPAPGTFEPAPVNSPTIPQPYFSQVPGTAVDIALPTYQLDEKDQIAALERIQYALSEVGDGKTYVWRRWHGRLSGLVQPTSSFKDMNGKVCRHLIVLMTTGKRTKKQEGVACRLPSGRWQLEG
jgi:surface antigen